MNFKKRYLARLYRRDARACKLLHCESMIRDLIRDREDSQLELFPCGLMASSICVVLYLDRYL